MEIVKKENFFQLSFENSDFVFDPPHLNFQVPIILTDIGKNINKNKIFNSPGEYNVDGVYFWGFSNKNSISYLFEGKEGNILFTVENLIDENLKKIKLMTKEISALFLLNFFDEKLFSVFKPSLVITNKDINLPKFEKQKGERFKANLKKVTNLIFVFNK
jgi:hypothetical protein